MNREGPRTTLLPVAIRIANADRATEHLLREWLQAAGYRVLVEGASEQTDWDAALVIVDVPYTRHGASELLARVAARHPGIPILALSATFFSNVKYSGDCAVALGVAGVLPKPVPRDTLLAAVENLVHRVRWVSLRP